MAGSANGSTNGAITAGWWGKQGQSRTTHLPHPAAHRAAAARPAGGRPSALPAPAAGRRVSGCRAAGCRPAPGTTGPPTNSMARTGEAPWRAARASEHRCACSHCPSPNTQLLLPSASGGPGGVHACAPAAISITRCALPRAMQAASLREPKKAPRSADSPPYAASCLSGKPRKWMVSRQGSSPPGAATKSYRTPAGTPLRGRRQADRQKRRRGVLNTLAHEHAASRSFSGCLAGNCLHPAGCSQAAGRPAASPLERQVAVLKPGR